MSGGGCGRVLEAPGLVGQARQPPADVMQAGQTGWPSLGPASSVHAVLRPGRAICANHVSGPTLQATRFSFLAHLLPACLPAPHVPAPRLCSDRGLLACNPRTQKRCGGKCVNYRTDERNW